MSPAAFARCFVVVGRTALASPEFLLDDVPGTSGRLDVLLRCLRAGLLCSHGVRRDTAVLLVLGGGPRAPRTLRFDGATAKFLRPDERSLAVLVRKALAAEVAGAPGEFVAVRAGVERCEGGLAAALAALRGAPAWVLEEGAPDVRGVGSVTAPLAVVLGDHQGFADEDRALLAAYGARPVSLGPVSVHAEDAVTLAHNELDRRLAT